MSFDAMKLALEALEEAVFYISSDSWSPSMTRECEAAITALRAAIEQVQEPVVLNGGRLTQYPDGSIGVGTPAKPDQWQGLTDDEREHFRRWAHPDMIEAIELRLQERNT